MKTAPPTILTSKGCFAHLTAVAQDGSVLDRLFWAFESQEFVKKRWQKRSSVANPILARSE